MQNGSSLALVLEMTFEIILDWMLAASLLDTVHFIYFQHKLFEKE